MLSSSPQHCFNRRSFLQAAGAAGCYGLVAGEFAAAAPSKKVKRFRKALKIGMVRVPGSLAEKFKLLKRIGFDGVELNSPNDLKLKEVLQAQEVSGLAVPGVIDAVHWKQRLSDPDPEVRAAGVKALKTAIDDARAYGATSVLLVPGRVTKDASYEQAWERSQAEIKKVAPYAEDRGIHVLIENVWNDFLTDPKEMARYIDEIDSKMVGAYFDVGNAVYYAPPVEWIKVLGKRIVKLDIKEFDLGKAKKDKRAGFRVKLLEGDCNWPGVIEALEKLDFSGWGSAEVPGGDEARLRDISERMDRIFSL